MNHVRCWTCITHCGSVDMAPDIMSFLTSEPPTEIPCASQWCPPGDSLWLTWSSCTWTVLCYLRNNTFYPLSITLSLGYFVERMTLDPQCFGFVKINIIVSPTLPTALGDLGEIILSLKSVVASYPRIQLCIMANHWPQSLLCINYLFYFSGHFSLTCSYILLLILLVKNTLP